MRARDIWQLAQLRGRSRAGRRTSATIAIGLVLLIPVVWILLAFYGEIYVDEEKKPGNRIFSYYTLPDEVYTYGEEAARIWEDKEQRGDFLSESELKEYSGQEQIFSPIIDYNRAKELSFTIDGDEYADNLSSGTALSLKAVGDRQYLSAMDDYMQGDDGVIIGEGFSDDTAEIYISELLLDEFGLDRSVLGKTASLSLTFNGEKYSENYNVPDNDTVYDNPHLLTSQGESLTLTGKVTIFENFKIAGIINREYYGIRGITDKDAAIWIKYDSFVMPGGEVNIPEFSVQDIYDAYGRKKTAFVFTYPSADYVNYSQTVAAAGRAFFFTPGTTNLINGDTYFNGNNYPVAMTYVQYRDFYTARRMMEKAEAVFGDRSFHIYPSTLKAAANDMRTTDIICLVLGIVGGISLVTCIVNYSGAAAFSLRKRKNFLDMMEKMGITEKDRRKLILFETLAILLRALIAAAVVTVILVLIAWLVFATALPSAKEYASCLVYALPAYLLCALALTLVMLLIFAFISVGEKGRRARVKFKHKES